MSYTFSWDCTLPINNIQDILSINIVPETKNYNEGNYLSLRGKIAVDGEYVANDQSRHPFREDIPLDIILPNNGRSKDIRAEVTNFDYEVKNGKVLFLKVDLILKGYEIAAPSASGDGASEFGGWTQGHSASQQVPVPAPLTPNAPAPGANFGTDDYEDDELPYDDDPFAGTAKDATEPLSDFASWQNVLQGQEALHPSTNAPGSNFAPWQQAAAGQPFQSQSAQSSNFTSWQDAKQDFLADASEGVTGTGDSFDSYAAYLGRKEQYSHLPKKQVPQPVPAPAPVVHHHQLQEVHEETTFGGVQPAPQPAPVVEPAPIVQEAPAPVPVPEPAPAPVPVPEAAPAPAPVAIQSVENIPEPVVQPAPAVVHHPELGEAHYTEYFGAGSQQQGNVATTANNVGVAHDLGTNEQVQTFGGQSASGTSTFTGQSASGTSTFTGQSASGTSTFGGGQSIITENIHPALGGGQSIITENIHPALGGAEQYTTFGGGNVSYEQPALSGSEEYSTFGGGNVSYEQPYLSGQEQYTTFGGSGYENGTGQYNTYGDTDYGQEHLTDSYEQPYVRPEQEVGSGLKMYKGHGYPSGQQSGTTPVNQPSASGTSTFSGQSASGTSTQGGQSTLPSIPGIATHGYSAVSQHQLNQAAQQVQAYNQQGNTGQWGQSASGTSTFGGQGTSQGTAATSNNQDNGYWVPDTAADAGWEASVSGTSTFGGGQSASGTSTFGGQNTGQFSAVQGIHGYSAISQNQLNQAAQQVQAYNQQGNATTGQWGQGQSASGTSTFAGQSASGTSTFGGGQSASGTSTFSGQGTVDNFVSQAQEAVQSQTDDVFPFLNNQTQTQTVTTEVQPKSSIFQMLGHLDDEYGTSDEELAPVTTTQIQEQATPILQEVVSPIQEEVGNFGSLYGNQVLSYYSKKISASKKAAEEAAAPVIEERPQVASYFDSSVAKQFSDGASFIKVIFVQEDRTVESFCAEHDITEANIYNFESYDSLLKAGDRIMVNYGRRQ